MNYCEVVILEDGTIEYAMPSHKQKMESICREMGVDPLEDCPRSRWCDYDTWLMEQTGCVLVWHGFYQAVKINPRQRKALMRLQLEGCCDFAGRGRQ